LVLKQTRERIEAQKKYEAERRSQARNGGGQISKGKGIDMSDCTVFFLESIGKIYLTHFFAVDTMTEQHDLIMENLFSKLMMSRREYKTKEKLQLLQQQQQQKLTLNLSSSELDASEILESIYQIQ
jgi:hypothetical protein